jgi:hypothetical protein
MSIHRWVTSECDWLQTRVGSTEAHLKVGDIVRWLDNNGRLRWKILMAVLVEDLDRAS